jgi:HD-like signal output (HDOD) protein
LTTAVVAQKLAEEFAHSGQEQGYLAGLLHDIGILINALLFPEEFHDVMLKAVQEHSSFATVEQHILGFTHAESGRIVAELWRLPVDVSEVIEYHHRPTDQQTSNTLTVVVQVANQLCWKYGMGYGFDLPLYAAISNDDLWQVLAEKCSRASRIPAEERAPLLESYLSAAREQANQVFRATPSPTPEGQNSLRGDADRNSPSR